MYCRYCGQSIDQNAKFCPNCGSSQDAPAPQTPTVNTTVNVINQGRGGQHTTLTSDKSRKKALLLLCTGLGLHLFYVGKIFKGIIRFFMGFLFWSLIFMSIGEPDIVFGGVLLLVVFNIADLIRLLLGKFTDNVGMCLRE